MKKYEKRLALIAIAVCLLLGIFFGVVRFSMENLNNILQKREKIVLSPEGSAPGDPTLCFAVPDGKTVYVGNVRVGGELPEGTVSLAVRLNGNEERTLPVEVRGSSTYVCVEAEITALTVLPLSDGSTPAVEKLTLNPRNPDWNLKIIFLFVFLAVVLVALLDFLFDRREVCREFAAMKHYQYLLLDLVAKDIKTKYRRSVLGILWSVLNPLLMMLVLTAVFSTIFNYRTSDFSVYYLTGYLLFNFVMEATTFSMTSILGSAGLIKKVYIPKFVFPLEKCLFSLVNMLFSLIAAVIVFLIVGVEPHWTMLLFPIPLIYLFVFNFGMSLILATLNTFFRDVGYLYNVFITVWMYLTPIIYPVEILPAWLLPIIKINPLYHYVQYFRNVTLYGTVPTLEENLVCIALSLTFLLIGFVVFRKKQDKFIFYI